MKIKVPLLLRSGRYPYDIKICPFSLLGLHKPKPPKLVNKTSHFLRFYPFQTMASGFDYSK